jgi:hypothetical protein
MVSRRELRYILIIILLVIGLGYSIINPIKGDLISTVVTYDTIVYHRDIINPVPRVEKLVLPKVDILSSRLTKIYINKQTPLTYKDSLAIIDSFFDIYGDYYTERLYNDTLMNDTTAFIQINSKVYMNKQEHISLTYENRTPTTITSKYEAPKLSIGGVVGYNSAQVGVLYRTKKGIQIHGGYDILNKGVQVGAYYPIW